jgi:valyl-tRNA synthetase
MIDKTYLPSEVEGRIYKKWEEAGAFRAGRPERAQAAPYSIVIPPPNVTGSLHMGHALNNTLQDILARFERMRGKDVLWQPGTDHAGIATQMVVERQLMERQEKSRRDMGRTEFLKRVWAWKEESGGTIINQLKRLGASCDWSRERFTMGKRGEPDDQMVKAVMKAFVDLYNTKLPDGSRLIYKDKRLVNWDPKLLTAISDLEVVQVETKGHLWHLRYPIEGKTFNPEDKSTYIVVATTRPETMLGDTAVAVHPDDERYKEYVNAFKAGRPINAILPLVGRKIPIIADEYSDPEKGSGAVKITPAHDFNDFEVGKRHNLAQINILTREARLTFQGNFEFLAGIANSPDTVETLEALDRKHLDEARKIIVPLLENKGYVEKIEPQTHAVPHGDRSNAVIQPFLTNQWYVDAKKLAEPAIKAVSDGETKFVPENWVNTYFNWMENIQPWCISRQLWWGHQIPGWYGRKEVGPNQWASIFDDPEIFVATTEDEAVQLARQKYGCDIRVLARPPVDELDPVFQQIIDEELDGKARWEPIWRDEDVLDTWFSSALWPFSTLGWPDDTKELKRFYPTSALVTGFDIIFFWVARMMMMGLHFMKEIPFHDIYIHRLVRDAQGAKMSKSKGNVVDPLGVIDEYGADALRFTLARNVAPGHDIRLGPHDVENNRNFATKLWNAARFAEMNGCVTSVNFDPLSVRDTINRWIIHETANAAGVITWKLKEYKFNEAAGMAYLFVWNIYCDWYLELAKPVLLGEDSRAKAETSATVAWVRDEILKLLHPFMPFLTEELWHVTEKRGQLLTLTRWPNLVTEFNDPKGYSDAGAETEIGWLIELVTAIRSVRAEMNIPAGTLFPLGVAIGNVQGQTVLEWSEVVERWKGAIMRLARVSSVDLIAHPGNVSGQINIVVRGHTAVLFVGGVIDLAAERARLAKEMAKADADIARCDAKLNNPKFIERAAEEVVDEEKEKRAEAVARKARIAEALERLKGAS